jgi:hypothetical protein
LFGGNLYKSQGDIKANIEAAAAELCGSPLWATPRARSFPRR